MLLLQEMIEHIFLFFLIFLAFIEAQLGRKALPNLQDASVSILIYGILNEAIWYLYLWFSLVQESGEILDLLLVY